MSEVSVEESKPDVSETTSKKDTKEIPKSSDKKNSKSGSSEKKIKKSKKKGKEKEAESETKAKEGEEEEPEYPAGPNWIALINPKSGGQTGQGVLKQFRELRLLPEDQIFSLIPDGPDPALQKWLEKPDQYKFIVCGGDGTAGWVLSALDKLGHKISPPVGVIPLGTGNDLARVFGWGGGYSGEKLAPILKKMADAKVIQLDRWKIVVTPTEAFDPEKHNKADEDDASSSGSDKDEDDSSEEKKKKKKKDKTKNQDKKGKESKGKEKEDEKETEEEKEKEKEKEKDKDKEKEKEDKGKEKEKEKEKDKGNSKGKAKLKESKEEAAQAPPEPQTFIMNNYFSIGVDAEIALSFHHLRELHTGLFQNVLINKGWYGAIGAKAALTPHGAIRQHVKIVLDGKEIEIPRKVRGVLVINLPSYMGGTQPWGEKTKKNENYSPPAIDDGLFEVIGLKGALHLARIQTHTSVGGGIRLGQGKSLKVTVTRALPAQVDGEPWAMVPCEVTINHLNKANLLYNIHAKGADAKEKKITSPSLKKVDNPSDNAEDGASDNEKDKDSDKEDDKDKDNDDNKKKKKKTIQSSE
jgi:diacylglycerol kinase family enzyme